MTPEGGSILIRDAIQKALTEKKSLLVGRFGTAELAALNDPESQPIRQTLELNAGVFPSTQAGVATWAEQYRAAIRTLDIVATGWYAPMIVQETELLDTLAPRAKRVPLRSLEPYYHSQEKQWTSVIPAKTSIVVISSFAKTILNQYTNNYNEIWPESPFPTNIKLHTVQTGYSPRLANGRAEWPTRPTRWQEAVATTVKKSVETQAKIAIIGAGGLGLIIAAELKAAGMIVIVLGGATQVLFGIKGHRWATHSVISKFWNSSWVWPDEEETPNNAKLIEGGCYWGR